MLTFLNGLEGVISLYVVAGLVWPKPWWPKPWYYCHFYLCRVDQSLKFNDVTARHCNEFVTVVLHM